MNKAKDSVKAILNCFYDNCNFETNHFKDYESHQSLHRSVIENKCIECNLYFETQESLLGHKEFAHSEEDIIESKYFCVWNECKFETEDYHSFESHKVLHKNSIETESNSTSGEYQLISIIEMIFFYLSRKKMSTLLSLKRVLRIINLFVFRMNACLKPMTIRVWNRTKHYMKTELKTKISTKM